MSESSHCHRAVPPVQGEDLAADADWLCPCWPAPPHVHALCSTRAGGVSSGAFSSMNLGTHVGDAPDAVAMNRQRLQAALQHATPGARPVFLNQVHGSSVLELAPGASDGACADAALTAQAGLACTIMVADCLPVLITDQRGRVVAAAHAGWRGLVGGVLESVLERFRVLALTHQQLKAIEKGASEAWDAADLLVWLGPCIGPQAFEVGAEVREAFCAVNAQAAAHFAPQVGGKYLADLPALARQRLAALGVSQVYGNDGSDAWCTVAQNSRFFSHRQGGGPSGGTGRMAACIWLG
ncbi:MAG: peptidoglycan editing factor PgeF [Simplicispira suum]|uniref:peptidoglycan editing factor PgeF n=1 Tax=Simplicispira suum TaxID=2109915 RepID=UPI001C6CB493|nr:peptidoglycan editing factor PgeF [Simplicispira suum]MBW7833527.1 peptidoglycan editing factor PgeF [Simplicispira suum]